MKLARRAQDLEPDNTLFSYAENEALLALRRFDVLIEETDRALEESPYDGNSVAQAVRLHVAAGERQRAQEIIDAFVPATERNRRRCGIVANLPRLAVPPRFRQLEGLSGEHELDRGATLAVSSRCRER